MIESRDHKQTLKLTITVKFGSDNQLSIWLDYLQVFFCVFAEHFESKHNKNSIKVNAIWK